MKITKVCKRKFKGIENKSRSFFYRLIFLFLLIVQVPVYASGSEDTRLKAKVYYYERILKDSSLNAEMKIEGFDSLSLFYKIQGKRDERYDVQKKKIAFLQTQGNFLPAIHACKDILLEIEQKKYWDQKDSLQYVETKLRSAIISISTAMYEEAASFLVDVLKLPSSQWVRMQACSYMGYIYMRNNKMDESMEFHQKALSIYKNMAEDSIKKKQGHIVYNHLAGLYYSLKKFDSAIFFLQRSIDDLKEDSPSIIFAYHNMSLIYQEVGETKMAEEYFQKTIVMSRRAGNHYIEAAAMQNLAYLYVQEGLLDKADKFYTQAIDLAEKINANHILAEAMIDYADLLFQKGRYKEFKEFYTNGLAKRDSLVGLVQQEKMDQINYKHESYKMESEKKLLEQNLKLISLSNQKKKYVLLVFVFLTMVLTLGMLKLVKKIQRQNKETIQNQENHEHLENSNEQKTRELASRALYIVQIKEVFKRMEQLLDQAEESQEIDLKNNIIRNLKREVKHFEGTDGWDEFKLYFEQIHTDFYVKLTQAAPELSPVEQRLCALLASNLTTKEIAEITNRSVRTTETMIYRIRKKFQLSSEVKLPLFLQNFL